MRGFNSIFRHKNPKIFTDESQVLKRYFTGTDENLKPLCTYEVKIK